MRDLNAFRGPQSLLPVPKIQAFNDWMRDRDRNEAVSQSDGNDTMPRPPIDPCDLPFLWRFLELRSASVTYSDFRQISNKQEPE